MARGGFAPQLEPAVSLLLKLERADAEQLPRCSDHCGAAPIRVCRRREDRFVQHVFPIAGKFLFGDDARRDRALASSRPGHDDAIVEPCLGRAADRQRGRVEPRPPLHHTNAGLLPTPHTPPPTPTPPPPPTPRPSPPPAHTSH